MHSPGWSLDQRWTIGKTCLLVRGNEVHFLLRRLFQRDASLRSLSPRPVHYLLPYQRPLLPVPLMQLGTLSQQQYRTRRVARGHWETTGPRITDRPRWQMTCPSSRSLSRGQESREMVADPRVRKFRPSPTSTIVIPRPPDFESTPVYRNKNRR